MNFVDKSLEQFIEELSSKAPTPGGGGASALVGALGVALGMMVGNLTVGKSSYAIVEKEMQKLMKEAESIKAELVKLIDKDAECFAPLAKAYSIPKDDPSRGQVMEDALRLACTVPIEIMKLSARAIELSEEFVKNGSRQALSDAGISAVFCKAALQGASLNVFINTKYMDNRAFAKAIETETLTMLSKYIPKADEIYQEVVTRLM